jgi:uncharacterized membrane protein YbhN (UPF0104 family)
VSLGLLGAAAYFLVGRASEVAAAWHLLGHLHWAWVGLAVLFEAASMVVFARMQRWLLRAGGVEVPLRTMVEITLAGNAVAATLPGGVAWAGAWVFGQLRRRGVSRFLRVWVFLVAGAVSSFALFVVVAVGIELAGQRGPVSGLRWATLGLAAIPVLGVIVLAVRDRTPVRQIRQVAASTTAGVPGGRWLLGKLRALAGRVAAFRVSPLGWAEVLGLGLLNWLDDCAVLVACMLALHLHVPWRGIFVVYGLTQIAAALPVTPGGIGVVEGTLAALLHAYGVPVEQALATVVVYRIVSFWGLVPVGWGVWVALDLLQQRGRRAGVPHPWAEHRHGEPDTPQGAERRVRLLPRPAPCAGCPDEQGETENSQVFAAADR